MSISAAPMEQTQCLDFVSGEIISDWLINIAELFIEKFVPAMRHYEVNRD